MKYRHLRLYASAVVLCLIALGLSLLSACVGVAGIHLAPADTRVMGTESELKKNDNYQDYAETDLSMTSLDSLFRSLDIRYNNLKEFRQPVGIQCLFEDEDLIVEIKSVAVMDNVMEVCYIITDLVGGRFGDDPVNLITKEGIGELSEKIMAGDGVKVGDDSYVSLE